jgi:Cu/Ag efflux protein CusF
VEVAMKLLQGITAVIVSTVMLWSGAVLAQPKAADCDAARMPSKVTGQVIKVDGPQEKVTIRANDGTTHEFQASKETLQNLKAGDRIEATLRHAPKC